MKTSVYIDGFNLYYGCLKDTPYRWLDLGKMCQLLLPTNQINKIDYFTARVTARPNDPYKPERQRIYLRALQLIPNLSIVLGHFLSHEVKMRLAHPPPAGPNYVTVVKTEEKGSDVNIASHILRDGFLGRYDMAVLVSNDSDLAMPLEIVVKDLKLRVGILNPQQHQSKELKRYATFVKDIRKGVLQASQFPPTLTDSKGTFYKPAVW